MQATSSRRASGLSILVLNNREEFSGATVIANVDHPLRKQMPFPAPHDNACSQLARLYGNVRSGSAVRWDSGIAAPCGACNCNQRFLDECFDVHAPFLVATTALAQASTARKLAHDTKQRRAVLPFPTPCNCAGRKQDGIDTAGGQVSV